MKNQRMMKKLIQITTVAMMMRYFQNLHVILRNILRRKLKCVNV